MKNILITLLLITGALNAQTELFPGKLNISPFTAHYLEPRMGFIIQTNENDIRLDIGNSQDVLHYKLGDYTFSFGADFFTYTLLRGEPNFHFPVDAVDYLFGVNFGIKKTEGNREYGARVRLSHISAHFVDGHYDGSHQKWRNDVNPIVYSREFVEILPWYKCNNLRFYGGVTWIFHVDPTDLGSDIWRAGAEYFYPVFLDGKVSAFAAYDLEAENLYDYEVNHTLMAGVKTGETYGKGFALYFKYYNGKNIHGEYFYRDEEYTALGITIDF